MSGFTWLHWLTFAVLGMAFVGMITFSLMRLKGQVQYVTIGVAVVFGLILSYISLIALDKKTKKSTLYKLENKRVLRTEEMIFTGYVINSGYHKIANVEMEIKLINLGKATGRVRGTDFYRTNSLFGDLFKSKSDKRKSRPGTRTYTFDIAQNLEPEKRKKFKVRFKFPPYFKDVDFRITLKNDYASQTARWY